MLDNIIAYYGAPALAGIKPSNICSFSRRDHPDAEHEIDTLNSLLNDKGIYFEILCSCKRRVMIMIYRKQCLKKYIFNDEIHSLLCRYGYPQNGDLKTYIEFLKKRISSSGEFPHEIGAFLGYPAEDIYAFINGDKKCLYTGYWKVYHDVESSLKIFKRYDICRNALRKRIDNGHTIVSLFGNSKRCA